MWAPPPLLPTRLAGRAIRRVGLAGSLAGRMTSSRGRASIHRLVGGSRRTTLGTSHPANLGGRGVGVLSSGTHPNRGGLAGGSFLHQFASSTCGCRKAVTKTQH